MLDVLHYLFEEDAVAYSAEHYESRGKVRDIVYETIYNSKFKYSSSTPTASDYGFDDLDAPVNFTPNTNREVKPYFPPTPFNPDAPNPFGAALREKPLG